MQIIKYLILTTLILVSCESEMKFDKEKWSETDDFEFPYRNRMLKDLLSKYNFKGFQYRDVINILGDPTDWGDDFFSYQILIHFNSIDPDYLKELKFDFGKDSIIKSFEVTEHKSD
jgi:hypothetical protein